jgi:membrane protein
MWQAYCRETSVSIVIRARAVIAAFHASLPGRVLGRYGQDRCDVLAASVAFTMLFSMVPVILGVLTIVGLIVSSPDLRVSASELILSTIPADSMASVLGALDGISRNTRLFGLLTAFGVVWAGTSLFRALEAALNQVFQAPPRSVLRQPPLAVGLILLFALLVIVQMTSASVVQFVGRFAGSLPIVGPGAAPAVAVLSAAISLGTAFAFSLAVYYVVPNLRLPVRHIIPGTLLASIAIVLLTQVFPLYVRYLSGFNQYGAILGLFFVLLTWAHLVADAFLLGAELNAVLRPVPAEQGAGAMETPVGSTETPL